MFIRINQLSFNPNRSDRYNITWYQWKDRKMNHIYIYPRATTSHQKLRWNRYLTFTRNHSILIFTPKLVSRQCVTIDIICKICFANMWQWTLGTRKSFRFAIPILWREPNITSPSMLRYWIKRDEHLSICQVFVPLLEQCRIDTIFPNSVFHENSMQLVQSDESDAGVYDRQRKLCCQNCVWTV